MVPKGVLHYWVGKIIACLRIVLIYAFRLFLHPLDLLYERLKESVSYSGYNPRRSFQASFSVSALRTCVSDVELGFKRLQNISITAFLAGQVSHKIFELSPADKFRLLGEARIGAVSAWALDVLLTRYEDKQKDAAAEFYYSITASPSAESLRGRILERQLLKYFDSLKSPQIFPIRSLVDSSIINWTYPGPASRFTFRSVLFASGLQLAVDKKEPSHMVPNDPNFPAMASIVYDPSNGTLTFLQITTNPKHPVSVSGLKYIQSWLKVGTPLARFRPSKSLTHWKLIFVVPFDLAAYFSAQRFDGDTDKGEWAGKVDQYVVGIKEDTIWARTSS